MALMEGSMMVMAPKFEPYKYTTMDTVSDDSIDSDDERYNYVIDLDYKEDSNESSDRTSESPEHEADEKLGEDVSNSEKPVSKETTFDHKQCETTELETTTKPETTEVNMEVTKAEIAETTYNYTIKEEPVVNLAVVKDQESVAINERSAAAGSIKTEPKSTENELHSYTLNNGKLDYNNVMKEFDAKTNNMLRKDDTKDVKTSEPKSNDIYTNNGAINKSDSTNMCNRTTSVSNGIASSTTKPVGASKRKRKLDSTIANLMKAKSVCVREPEQVVTDSSSTRQAVESSTSVAATALASLSNLSYTVPDNFRSVSIYTHQSMNLSNNSTTNSMNIPKISTTHSMDLSKKVTSFSKPAISPPVSHPHPSVISSLLCNPSTNSSTHGPVHTNMSPTMAHLHTGVSTTPSYMSTNRSLNSPQASSMPSHLSVNGSFNLTQNSAKPSHVSSNGLLNLAQKSTNRRKSSVVYRCDYVHEKFDSLNQSQDVLNLSVDKVKQEPIKSEISSQDEVMDLSKSAKSRDIPVTNGSHDQHEGALDLSQPSKVTGVAENLIKKETTEREEKPVDLSNNVHHPYQVKREVKTEPELPYGPTSYLNGQTNDSTQKTDKLNVIDIFKDMMTQEKGGSVTMQQFMTWMQKMQPGITEKMNVVQLNAYYMQFNYWMQSFYNNALMSGYSGNKGLETQLLPQKNGRQRKKNRRSLPVPFEPSNTSSPKPINDLIDTQSPSNAKSPDISADDVMAKLNDYNANRIKQNDIEFPSCPEMNILKERFGCYIADRDGKKKFFVKDNEEINSIVDVVMSVSDLKELEMQNLVPDENGLCARLICRICDQKFFHPEHLSKHVKTLHVQKRFQCDQCERSFHDAGNYRQHMRVHDETDIPYECQECHRRFRHKCTLKVHMRIHTGEKPFRCDVCGATFKISSGLQTHMRKHTGETPYACEFCSLRFKCQSNLKQHLFQHTQARPFPCDICGKSYSRKSIRDSHLLTHYRDSSLAKDLNITV